VILAGIVRGRAPGRVAVAMACAAQSVIECQAPDAVTLAPGDAVEVSVRPEAVRIARACDDPSGGTLDGIVEAVLYQGERSECEVRLGSERVLVYVPPDMNLQAGDRIALALAPGAAQVWPK